MGAFKSALEKASGLEFDSFAVNSRTAAAEALRAKRIDCVTTSLFALEKPTRSSVILGLVGAGGFGLELKVTMDLIE